ncbi:ficolin-1-like [Ahaetulla prasina]|uniref:ficolin-1-like n=1 Tax=Ahaetulla prasina TaxID=499056 RepID=UPI002648DF2E|nr:ficolin-1-like [Ahaetulla prasina]
MGITGEILHSELKVHNWMPALVLLLNKDAEGPDVSKATPGIKATKEKLMKRGWMLSSASELRPLSQPPPGIREEVGGLWAKPLGEGSAPLYCLSFCPGARSCKELLVQGMVLSGWHTVHPLSTRSFQVAAESDWYWLTLGNFTGGTAGDSLSYHNHMPFSTQERKPDTLKFNCAEMYEGAWWYNECHYSNLNGKYWLGEHNSYADGINWRTGKGYKYSYKLTEMKIRAVA